MANAKARFVFCHQLLLKLSRVRGNKNKKTWLRGNFVHFQIFESFGNLEIDFSNFKQNLLNHDQWFWSYTIS